MNRCRHLWNRALLAAAIGLPVPGLAQAYDRVAPKLPPAAAVPTIATPETAALRVATDSGAVVLPNLAGLVFASLAAPGLATVAGVDAHAVGFLDDPAFIGLVQPYIGKPLTMRDLDQIASITQSWYRSHRRPFVEITIPPQNIAAGVVRVLITEYRVGKVEVTGNRYFSSGLIRRSSGLEAGQLLTLPKLQGDLNRLNQNPFMTISAVVRPGSATGETDVVLETHDRLPLRFYAGYDNLGVRSLGLDQWNVGVNWGNVLETGQILSYQYTSSVSGRYASHSASNVVSLPWGDRLLVFGSYATQKPLIATGFNSIGHSGQVSARYVYALRGPSWLTQDAQVGFDYKRTDNNLEFSGFRLLQTAAEIAQIPLIYNATASDRFGQTSIQDLLVVSPGRITGRNTDAAIAALVPGAKASYVYNRFTMTRTTALPAAISAITRITLQISSHNLPYSEQLSGGGTGSVRGYYTDTAIGSRGVLISQEIRAPAFSVSRLLIPSSLYADLLQFGLFADYSYVTQPHALPDLPRSTRLASVGLNMHYNVTRFFDIQLDLARQLRRAPGNDQLNNYATIAVTAGF